jgi:hypothetical protein
MKSYIDFVSDIAVNSALLTDLEQAVPFPTEQACINWFQAKGYELSAEEATMLFENQIVMIEDTEHVQY